MRPTFSIAFCLLFCFASPSFAVEKTIYGLNEYALLADFNQQLPAKLDTGAKTSSLSAHDIQRFSRDGVTWVRFRLGLEGTDTPVIERPLARISKIKRRAGDMDPEENKSYTARPVIELQLCLGQAQRMIEVNLTDRSAFQYPLLIGSEALKQFEALVDPSLKYAAGKPDCEPDAPSGE